MATKLQVMSELAAQTTEQLTRSVDSWTSFLNSAAWLYKYPFHEQMLIYAQRPDAKACAPIGLWNSKFKRWVNRGAKGIALIDDSGQKPALRYVFDVSDTNTRHNIPFRLWQTKPEYEAQIIEELENHFGETGTDGAGLTATVLGISINAVSDNYRDYYEELLKAAGNSALADLSEDEISSNFMLQLMTSVSHTVLVRLGIDPATIFHGNEYDSVMLFDSPDTIAQLGAATSDISEMILRQIERSVRSMERQERGTLANAEPVLQNEGRNNERSDENGTQLQTERGLSDTRHRDGRSAGGDDRQIRQNAENLSEGAPEGLLQQPSADERADDSPLGDRQSSTGTDGTDRYTDGESRGRDGEPESGEPDALGSADGTDRYTDGESRGRDGEPESGEPDALGSADEQHSAESRGDGAERPDLRITTEDSLFPTLEEQLEQIEEAEAQKLTAFSISQADIDNELCRHGSGFSNGKLRIYKFFEDMPSSDAAIAFLKREYGIGGHSHTYLNGESGFVDHDGKGIRFSNRYYKDSVSIPWKKNETRLRELIALDRYLTEKEKAFLPEYETKEAERRLQLAEEATAREALRAAAVAMDERRKDAQYAFSLGDTVQLGATTYTILGYDEHTVMLSDPKYPLLSEDMARDVFERRLRENPANDHLIVEGEPKQEVAADKDHPYVYAVGDVVYIDNTAFHITEVRDHEVEMRDPTLVYPVFRTENKETFHHLLEQDERNVKYYPSLPFRTVTETNVIEQPEISTETVAVYPAEENHLPYDIVIQTLRTEERGPEKPVKKTNFRITDDALGHGGPKAKFRMNMDAIRTLQAIEFENRLATPEEQEILSRYVGWGSLPQAFDENNPAWADEFQELYAALSPEEYQSARASVLNAHYTSPTVIKAIYSAIESMGFRVGNILEPSCGVGNFFGLIPESMEKSKLYGVELDSLTGRIARQLYQNANIAIQGFEETSLPDSFFDVAIGNVPFGDYGVADKRYDKNHFLIHDYFFAKALDKVRPGGIIAFITSSGTMDKKNTAVRKYIAQRADLLGAIRLPNNAFLANAGTGVVADILFLQKRDRPIEVEPDWVQLGKTEGGYTINQYFVDNPDMVLGELTAQNTQYAKQECTVKPIAGAELSEQLSDAIANIHAEITEFEQIEEAEENVAESIPADPNVRNFSFTVADGEIYFRENSVMNKVELSVTAQNRIKGMIGLRDCTRRLIQYQLEGYPDEVIEQEQQTLNTFYDDFTVKYGLINSRGNNMAFSDDASYCLLCSLEVIDENGALERKADMFTKRTIRQQQEIDHVDTAAEALAVSLAEKAKIDLAYMSELTGRTEDVLESELAGVVFRDFGSFDPEGMAEAFFDDKKYPLVPADEYLSGNVRSKLHQVTAIYDVLKSHTNNTELLDRLRISVEALQKVQPQDLTAGEIDVRLGATWIPESDIQRFMEDLLRPSYYASSRIKVHFSSVTAEWNISNKNSDYGNVNANVTYGTKRINGYKIIEETLNLKDVRIFDTVQDEYGNDKRVLNKRKPSSPSRSSSLSRMLSEIGYGKTISAEKS